MTITEFGKENERTFLLIPGTSCTWEINFQLLTEPLAREFRVLCMNCTGFDGGNEIFDTMTDETKRIEDYVLERHNGHLTAVYGSSMGGSFASLLAQRRRIHIDHVFIGSSDLDQASPFMAKIETALVSAMLKWMTKHPEKALDMMGKAGRAKGMPMGEEDAAKSGLDRDFMQHMMQGYMNILGDIDIRSIRNQFYSDLVTKVDDGIDIPGTVIHVFHSKEMGDKYLKRYYQHYAKPDIIPFDLGHEGWLGDPELMIETFNRCMEQSNYSRTF